MDEFCPRCNRTWKHEHIAVTYVPLAEKNKTLQQENIALRAELERAREALRLVEWEDYDGDGYCPWCNGYQYEGGHKPDCPRQKVLDG